MHTAANAWKARNKAAQRGRTVTVTEGPQAARPVSMARLTLQDQLDELPARLAALTGFLADLERNLATTRDVEAIAAEAGVRSAISTHVVDGGPGAKALAVPLPVATTARIGRVSVTPAARSSR